MSSRRLVLLVENLSEQSSTKLAMGDGWSLDRHLLVGVLNEQRLARADYAAAHGETVTPTLVPRPGERTVEEKRQEMRDVHDALLTMVAPSTENDDLRARLRRDVPQAPMAETDGG